MKSPVIIIAGPTASGKTALSLKLAKKFKGEIICADSMTVYRGMDIGTDKPTADKKRKVEKKDGIYIIDGIPHHLLDILDPDEEFNASMFKDKVKKAVSEIKRRGNVPFLVGGSLLYIDTYAYDYAMPKVAPDLQLRKELEKKSNEELFKELVALDPDSEWTVDRKNKRRLIRALEVSLKTGHSFSKQKSKKELPSNVLYLAVAKEREKLYEDINRRVDQMMKEGFLSEVEKLFEKYDHNTAMQAAGYKQLSEHVDGNMDLSSAIEKTKQVHRNFAKRQLTWLRKNQDVVWTKDRVSAGDAIRRFLSQN